MKSRWLRVVLVGTMLLVLASVGVGVSSAQVAPERPNFVVVMTDKVVGSGGAEGLYGEDGADTVNSKDGVKSSDRLDGGAGTDTKVTDTTEKSIVGFPRTG